VALVQDVLGRDALGAYLFGSAVLGGLKPRSDLDVIAVSTRPTAREEKRRLVERLLAVSGQEGRRRLELTIVVQSAIRPWRYPPSFDFQYGDWWRGEFERGDLEPWSSNVKPDLAVMLTMALLADRPLLGPPPAAVLDPVPHDDLVRAMVDLDSLLLDLDWDTANVVLTLARVWSTLATGEIRPKDEAADWTRDHVPEEHRAVLDRARAIYLGEEDDRWDDLRLRVRPHVDHVVNEIRRSGLRSGREPARRGAPGA
jgi:streptomycin 3"-adenylyltransferase